MTDPRDVMSPDVRRFLTVHRKGALSVLRGRRYRAVDNEETALRLVDIYIILEWKIELCDYGAAHPYCIFASRVLRSARLLMGEEWVDSQLQHY